MHKTWKRKVVLALFLILGLSLGAFLLFPPQIHQKIRKLRELQASTQEHFRKFKEWSVDNPAPLEPSHNASIEEMEKFLDKKSMGALGGMPLDFDAGKYFEILDRVKMEDGWVLDYFYSVRATTAYPVLYARRKDQARLGCIPGGKEEEVTKSCERFFDHLVPDGSSESFVQIAVLRLIGEQFYLFWHALSKDDRVVSRFPSHVGFGENQITVSLLVSSEFRGLSLYEMRLAPKFPHRFLGESFTKLIPRFGRVPRY